MAAASGARGEVFVVTLDSCSGSCNADSEDEPTFASGVVDDKATLLLMGSPSPGALLFDPEAVPTILASAHPSALLTNAGKDSGPQIASTYVDFEYVFTHPDDVGGPGLFLSVASLTGQFTLGDFLSDANAYFTPAFSSGLSPIGPDLRFTRSHGSPKGGFSFSTGYDEGSPKKAPSPSPTWLDSLFPVSQ